MGIFSEQVVINRDIEGVESYVMPTSATDVVTISGSMLGGSLHSLDKNNKVPSMTAAMLDKGTIDKDKYKISDILESVGAELHFSNTLYHTHFTGFCLKNDLDTVVTLLAEQVRKPSFSSDELSILKTRIIGNLERNKEDTKKLALIGLLRNIFPQSHPNYRETIESSIDLIGKVSTQDLLSFHAKQYGLGSLKIVAAGDLAPESFNNLIAKAFGGWAHKKSEIPRIKEKALKTKGATKEINVPDKTSSDLYLGQAIGIDRDHKDYYALMMGVYVLGGNFSARLMQSVRDKQGLTYGIGSSISGVSFGADGYWSTWGTFAPDILKKGKKATMEQIQLWFKNGITEEELSAKKNTIAGSFKVSLDSTSGLSGKILSNAEQNRTVSYLDKYPEIIKNISLLEVNSAIKKYIDPKNMFAISAGTVA